MIHLRLESRRTVVHDHVLIHGQCRRRFADDPLFDTISLGEPPHQRPIGLTDEDLAAVANARPQPSRGHRPDRSGSGGQVGHSAPGAIFPRPGTFERLRGNHFGSWGGRARR